MIWNPDGSTAELSGNGTRIAARWLAEQAGADEVRIRVGPREVVARLLPDGLVEQEMGAVEVYERERVAGLQVTAVSVDPVEHAIEVAKPGGTIILAGMKGSGRTIQGFSSDKVMMKELTIRGMNGQDLVAVEPALRLIQSGKYPLERMHTHTYSLDDAERAVLTLAGRVSGEDAISITIAPNKEER